MAESNIRSYSSGELTIQFASNVSITVGAGVVSATSSSVTLMVFLKKNGTLLGITQKTIGTYDDLPVSLSGDGVSLLGKITASNFGTTAVYTFNGTCTASSTESATLQGYLAGFTVTG